MPGIKIFYIIWPLLLLLVALFVFLERQTLGEWWWNTTNTLPEVVLFITQDPYLGVQMAEYYFDSPEENGFYNLDKSRRLYQTVIAMDETFVSPWYQLARIAFLYSDYEQSLQYIDIYQFLAEDPRPHSLYLEGLVLGFAGDTKASLRTLQAYYIYDNSSWYIHNNLAWTYFKLGNFTAMDTVTDAGLEHHPHNPWLLMNKGLAQYNLGNQEQALYFLDASDRYARSLEPKDWSRTYPGNDPAIAPVGLAEFRSILEANRKLIHKQR